MSANPASNMRTGAQVLVDQLAIQGVEHVFCVPGESYLAVLDAFHDAEIAITVCRQETGAGIMADACARLSGRPGVFFVTRGPGATNAAHAMHIAEHDSTPLVLFIGQVGRRMRGRGAFQEMDFQALFGASAKWVVEIDDAARIPEIVSRAFHVAMQGRPGPVAVALPEDMLRDAVAAQNTPHTKAAEPAPAPAAMARLAEALARAQRPLAILGGGGWSAQARARFQDFASRHDLPVATSFRRTSLFDADHPCYAGELSLGANPALIERIRRADFVLLAGGRMAEVPSQGYTLFDIPRPKPFFVHVHADSAELGRVYAPDIGICAAPGPFCEALAQLAPPAPPVWRDHAAQARADYLAFSDLVPEAPGAAALARIMMWLRERLPADAIVANGAGNYAIWVGRYLRLGGARALLAPVSGSMGYGLPAAVGAKRLYPERMVVSFAGDGCFLMNGQEFATAVQYGLPIVVIVIDNGMYGTIRMHQEREYPGRVSATALRSPDFAALARAFGGHGESVREGEEFAPAFERAAASGLPAIVHVHADPEAITPTATLSGIRAAALARRS